MIAPLLYVGGALALVLGGVAWHRRRDQNSVREDVPSMDIGAYDETGKLWDSLGWPYVSGGGAPSTPWDDGEEGVDCNGYTQMACVRLGTLSAAAIDRTATQMANICDELALGDQEPGDIAVYPQHTMVVCSYPSQDLHSCVIGASGGDSTVTKDNPKATAYVKLFERGDYRGDFICYARIRNKGL